MSSPVSVVKEQNDIQKVTPVDRWRKSGDLVMKGNAIASRFSTLRDMYWDIIFDNDRLQVLKKLGTGQFGTVLKCSYDDRKIAVKILKAEFKDTAEEDVFLKELQIMKKLRHPNIVCYVGTGYFNYEGRNELFLAQDVIDGGSLKHKLLKQCMARGRQIYTVLDAHKWVSDVAKGLQYLHNSNPMVLHRDLKPDNILLTADQSKAVIVDFGLHALVDKHQHASNYGYKLSGLTGSYLYMAPEVFMNRPYNEKVDVFSFGVIAFELFARDMIYCRAVRFGSPEEVLDHAGKCAGGERQPIPDRFPESLKSLIQDCWQQSPELRPSFTIVVQRLKDMKSDMEEWHKKNFQARGCCSIV
eukprot:TRINITY_DN818_c0_g2_i3.p2 TRINITY_DN818_c0_g2~~TRINITY_DN818_c0_g2_i3.p2  ORF type:complete len:356 (-),score=28.79 TRINITY_DN818_c0_g2_i3:2257-3324(-)